MNRAFTNLALPVALLAALVAAGCGGTGGSCDNSVEQAGVLVKLKFIRLSTPTTSVGFDIDNYTATPGDPMTCGHASLTDPDGKPGIDNTFGTLVPAIDAQVNGALDADIQDAINQGMLLFGIDVKHGDVAKGDGCANAEFHFLSGKPTVGSDKILDSWQTFDTSRDVAVSSVQGTMTADTFSGGPFDLELPVRVLDANFNLAVHGARIKLVFAEDGSFTGILGGRVKEEDILADFKDLAIGADLKKRLPGLLDLITDQDYDPNTGKCAGFSVALSVEARPAFINP